jgi:hypothetical protein
MASGRQRFFCVLKRAEIELGSFPTSISRQAGQLSDLANAWEWLACWGSLRMGSTQASRAMLITERIEIHE